MTYDQQLTAVLAFTVGTILAACVLSFLGAWLYFWVTDRD